MELALSILGVVLVAAAVWYMAIRPQSNKAAAASVREEAAVARASALRGEIAALEGLKRNAPALQRRASGLARLFPGSPALAELTDALQRTADQAGVELAGVQPSAPGSGSAADPLAELAADLEVRGGYFQIEDFLDRLEGLVSTGGSVAGPVRSVLVRSIDLSRGESGGAGTAGGTAASGTAANPGELTAKIGIVAFQRVDSAAPGVTSGAATPPAPGAGGSPSAPAPTSGGPTGAPS